MPPHRHTKNNALRTEKRIEKYLGKKAILDVWELQPDEIQIANHDYIIGLRARVRQERALLQHRGYGVQI